MTSENSAYTYTDTYTDTDTDTEIDIDTDTHTQTQTQTQTRIPVYDVSLMSILFILFPHYFIDQLALIDMTLHILIA